MRFKDLADVIDGTNTECPGTEVAEPEGSESRGMEVRSHSESRCSGTSICRIRTNAANLGGHRNGMNLEASKRSVWCLNKEEW
ncbi:predicted protein [Botrytis cinerea T4]|uniref:Uncharacterized protein n=1 Tax=Botryotinia fuckeliana (strain T4) TaxID=999810 RepID=G2XNM1_BOTF4|nr:predicted protein [Botrytis cinerea T4]